MFTKIDDSTVEYKGRNYLIHPIGLTADEFIVISSHLENTYKMKIKRIDYHTDELNPEARIEGKINSFREIQEFIIYAYALEENGIDITNLIKQTEGFNDYYVTRHANSLSLLGHAYDFNGNNINFNYGKGADISIDGIDAELKVCQPYVVRTPRVINSDIYEEIILSISKMISSRFVDGVKQADLVFFDLTGDALFSTLDLFHTQFNTFVEPFVHRLVLFSSKMYPVGEVGRWQGGKIVGTTFLKYPNNFFFNSYYIDFDKQLWLADFSKY